MTSDKSLRDRISSARSENSIQKLLDEGAKYPDASDKTRKSWQKAAAQRLSVLESRKTNENE